MTNEGFPVTEAKSDQNATSNDWRIPLTVLDDCSQGSCGQCSLCCRVMEKTVPSVPGEADSPLETYGAGVTCPQLVEIRGEFACALQAEKEAGHPNLQACRNWNGNGQNSMAQLLTKTEQWIINPPSRNEVIEIENIMSAGFLQTIRVDINAYELVPIIRRYVVELEMVPQQIFAFLRVRELLIEEPESTVKHILEDAGISTDIPLHRTFISYFVGNLPSDENSAVASNITRIERLMQRRRLPSSEMLSQYRLELLRDLMRASDQGMIDRLAKLIEKIESMLGPDHLGNVAYCHTQKSIRGI